jgi:DNA-binding transcriptional ArsR family regulator
VLVFKIFMAYNFDFSVMENATESLRAMAHPLRLAIVEMLHEKKQLSVTEIYEMLNIEQAVASHHLRIMKNRNIVTVRREGKNSIYSLTNDSFYQIVLLAMQK